MNVAPTLGTDVSSLPPEGALASLGRPGAGSVAPTPDTDASWSSNCPLCAADGGTLVWRGARLRVIHADEQGFPAFYRVVWNAHVAEFTDLAEHERLRCLQAVALVEQTLREHVRPTKVNLASLGNMVPHLHWHVVARHTWDSHWPAPIWAAPQRPRALQQEAELAACLPALHAALHARLAQWAAEAPAHVHG
ncbi:Diadenosine tetraphosphate (Ap4A) hydrolase [Oryzisolibacter propanilivorax]|uniref:Diadenosine tetraphosphate (Ap4A) hydrolase n=1 Tax=Oryzisolibacter propanilivorax TaxID=1527607 RepID=A0A1G9RDQ1_9BURK|nr:Diadenosine tetraphosphate (Ap4A) hydrolase [Oryzisolibacter propanilivorax]